MSIYVEHPLGTDLPVVTLTGEHDMATAHLLRRVLSEFPGTAPLVVLDLAPCQFIDSTILSVFAAAAKRIGSAGSRLVAINAHGIAAKAIHLTGLDTLLAPPAGLDASFRDALEQLGWHNPPREGHLTNV